MNLMICMGGEPKWMPFLEEITRLGAGVEFESYGMMGIRSEGDWGARFRLHQAVRAQFQGTAAMHGPFIGIEYAHVDHLIRDVVQRRLDMTFEVAAKLRASRVILHTGYTSEMDTFKLQEAWLERNIAYWQHEILRWAEAGIQIVFENVIEKTPDLQIKLVDEVDNPCLGLCLDIGHEHFLSGLGAPEWVRRMGGRLWHIHVHDNDRSNDRHWSIGRGTIDFESFYAALLKYAPQATLSLEVEADVETKMNDLRRLADRFASQ